MSAIPTIETVEQTGSTNADLLARLAAQETIPEGHWLRAIRQSGGRGRLGRKWESPEGNLYCSTVVNLRASDGSPHTLSFVAGLACYDALKQALAAAAPPQLKWPNDVLVGGKKIVGILLERTGESVVVGIGVNVSQAPDVPGRETTSILRESSRYTGDAAEFLAVLADSFSARLDRWRSEPLMQTLDAWTAAAHPIGTQLSVGGQDAAITGAFAGLNGEGALLLRLANGAVQTIHAGDVSLLVER